MLDDGNDLRYRDDKRMGKVHVVGLDDDPHDIHGFADLGPDAIVFELAGTPEEVDSFEELVRPHGVKELVRTGRIGLGRASSSQTSPRRQLALR